MTKLLSICIPTYNGGENFKYNVNKLIDMSLKYNFDICVSDNASTDDTQEYMLNLINKYDFIKYHRNDKNMGFAYNADYVLKMADTEYAWLLGDDDEIYEKNFLELEKILKECNFDLCIVNSDDNIEKIKKIPSRKYLDANELVSDLGIHMSWISTLIFSKYIIDKMNISKIKDNAFPFLIELLKNISSNCNVYWISNHYIKRQNTQQDRYSGFLLKYFIEDWCKVICFNNDYKEETKKIFCKDIAERMFSFRSIVGHRRKNLIDFKRLIKVKKYLKYYPKKYTILLFIGICIPKKILSYIYILKKGKCLF